jgi:pyruvate formate lyase activating enzyme
MLGCDLHCHYCQNWLTSQALRDEEALVPPRPTTAGELVELAARSGAELVASSYNEPLITSEWAAAVMAAARKRGFVTAYISNGNATPEVLDFLRPLIDCYKVDLKAMRQANYRTLGAKLENVLATIEALKARGFWVEIVTLLISAYNDGEDELRELARFLAGVDPLMPSHVTAFHADYHMSDRTDTAARQLLRAAEIGLEQGLRYVYCGNRPGQVGEFENTRCHACSATLVRRIGFLVVEDRLSPSAGVCPECGVRIPGIWESRRC